MNKTDRLSKYILDSAHQLKLCLDATICETDLTGQHVRILAFIEYCHSTGREVYQKDIETEFRIRRSSVSNVLDTMEKNGYICRVQSKTDSRMKRVILTDKAKETGALNRKKITEFEDRVESALTDEEIALAKILLNKVVDSALKMRGEPND